LAARELNLEKETIKRLAEGDKEAFTQIYHAYAEKVFYLALRYMKTRALAENLTQEVFIKLWETRERLDTGFSFNSYLFTITRNAVFNIHRKNLNELTYLNHLGRVFEYSAASTEEDFNLSELQQLLNGYIENLPEQRKKVFKLSRLEGLSHKEISEKLGLSEKTIATHIRLALKTLRSLLRKNNLLPLFLLCFSLFF